MELGFDTIGNATLICYDNGPILATDPWITGDAYFGSWGLAYEIPEEQMDAIKNSEYLWVSHAHPDHLSIKSLNILKNKKILIPDHVGSRVANDLNRLGFNVSIIKDRVWTKLSDRIHILSISDYNQDAILLVDLDGKLIANLNDATPKGWGAYIQKIIRGYDQSFLLQGFGYGTADMINFFDEDGERIEPVAALKLPIGEAISRAANTYGVQYVIPFSYFHKYQREDSAWVGKYRAPLEDYCIGFNSDERQLLPAFTRYDMSKDRFYDIAPPETPNALFSPSEFGDDWAEPLSKRDKERITDYFTAISHLQKSVDFIDIRVAGEDHVIALKKSNFSKGVIFEVPRRSLMRAIRMEIFEDLLIGNFMKATLVGKWPKTKLYPDLFYVCKYADNGLAKSPQELRHYFHEYKKRAHLDYIRHSFQSQVAQIIRSNLDAESTLYRLGQRGWWHINKYIGI